MCDTILHYFRPPGKSPDTWIHVLGGAGDEAINFGDEDELVFLGIIAKANPWEFYHKASFGQPGRHMPSGVDLDWSAQDLADLVSYVQALLDPRTLRGLLRPAFGRSDEVPVLDNMLIAPDVYNGTDPYEISCVALHGVKGKGAIHIRDGMDGSAESRRL